MENETSSVVMDGVLRPESVIRRREGSMGGRMEPSDSIGDAYRRIASYLEPAPTYEANTDAVPMMTEERGIADLVTVSADGTWIPELELMRQGFEIVRTSSHQEIERCIDAAVGPKRTTHLV